MDKNEKNKEFPPEAEFYLGESGSLVRNREKFMHPLFVRLDESENKLADRRSKPRPKLRSVELHEGHVVYWAV
jgi:hypothetical protein